MGPKRPFRIFKKNPERKSFKIIRIVTQKRPKKMRKKTIESQISQEITQEFDEIAHDIVGREVIQLTLAFVYIPLSHL